MWTDALSLHQMVVVGFMASAGAVAAWNEAPENAPAVRAVQRLIGLMHALANLSQKEAAHILDTKERDFSPQQYSLDIKRGGNLTAFAIIGIRHPAFGAALVKGLTELFGVQESTESRIARCERLIAEVKLSQKKVTGCEVRDVDDSLVG